MRRRFRGCVYVVFSRLMEVASLTSKPRVQCTNCVRYKGFLLKFNVYIWKLGIFQTYLCYMMIYVYLDGGGGDAVLIGSSIAMCFEKLLAFLFTC